MAIEVGQQIDANNRTITSNEAFLVSNSWTFVTGTTGATGAHTLFTVTGDVLVILVGVCKTSLTGAATLEVGVVNSTNSIVAQVADTTTIDESMSICMINGANLVGSLDGASIDKFVVGNSQDIIMTIGSTAVTAGRIDWYCLWRPLSSDGSVVATTPA